MRNYLEKLEEKFVFRTSHMFFHILVGAAMLVIIGGILLFLWGMTPSFKPGVSKSEYPPVVEVTTQELAAAVLPKAELEKGTAASEAGTVTAGDPGEAPAAAQSSVDPAQKMYEDQIDSLKALLPPEKFSWVDQGHWQRSYYRNRWVVDVYGIQSRLNAAFSSANARSFDDKAIVLRSYLPLLSGFEETERLAALKSLITYSKDDPVTTQGNMALLQQAIVAFPADQAEVLNTLAEFGQKNPRDGRAFIRYASEIIPRFDPAHATEVLGTLVRTYYNYFDDIERQKRATETFFPLLSTFEGKYQAKALEQYYGMYLQKNREREQQVVQIDQRYQNELQQAEAVLAQKRAEKAVNRYYGMLAIGGSLVFISIIALVLVLLSIQRNVRALASEVSAKESVAGNVEAM